MPVIWDISLVPQKVSSRMVAAEKMIRPREAAFKPFNVPKT